MVKLFLTMVFLGLTLYPAQVYAPQTRVGVFLDRGSELYNVKNRYLNTYEGMSSRDGSLEF